MTPPGTKNPADQGAAAKAQPNAAPGNAVQPCAACTVKLTPNPVSICDTAKDVEVTATGNPAGGNISAWTIADPAIATVTPSGGNKAKVKALKAGKTTLEVTYHAAGCTCTDKVTVQACTLTPGRKYANAMKNVANVIGVRAKIKTRYGKVTCEDEGCSTKSAYNVVYANVSGTGAAGLIWAQSGFGRERNPGGTAIVQYRYAEMNGGAYNVNYDTANAPAEGSVHQYQCVLNNTTGQWTYSQDGAAWQNFADAQWTGATGDSIQYTSEIFNSEDDGAGTAGNKCEITECQYLLNHKVQEDPTPTVLSNFGFDESTITPQHQAIVDAIAERVHKSMSTTEPVKQLRIVGHTDPVGSDGYNIGLGQRRALAACNAINKALEAKEAGLSGKVACVTESKGESELVDKSGTAAGNALNRRAEVFFSSDLPDWLDAGLVKGDVSSDDDAEWGAEWISGTALNVWDKKPLP